MKQSLQDLIDALLRLEEAEELLQKIHNDYYFDKKLSDETLRALERFNKFDDSE